MLRFIACVYSAFFLLLWWVFCFGGELIVKNKNARVGVVFYAY